MQTSVAEVILETKFATLLKRNQVSTAFWDLCATSGEETDAQEICVEKASQSQATHSIAMPKVRHDCLFEMRADGKISRFQTMLANIWTPSLTNKRKAIVFILHSRRARTMNSVEYL